MAVDVLPGGVAVLDRLVGEVRGVRVGVNRASAGASLAVEVAAGRTGSAGRRAGGAWGCLRHWDGRLCEYRVSAPPTTEGTIAEVPTEAGSTAAASVMAMSRLTASADAVAGTGGIVGSDVVVVGAVVSCVVGSAVVGSIGSAAVGLDIVKEGRKWS